jgi:hypothetical protein
MREFTSNVSEAMATGLRKRSWALGDTMAMESCKGMRATPLGLRTLEPITIPTGWEPTTFPYPQVFKSPNELVMVTGSAVYDVDATTYAVTPITVYQASSPLVTFSFTETTPWQFYGFDGGWFLFNESTLLMKIPQYDGKVVGDTNPTIQAGGSWNDRLVLGGVASPNIFGAANFLALWEEWLNQTDGFTYTGETFDESFIMWGERFGGDIDHPFYTQMAVFGFPGPPVGGADNSRTLSANLDSVRRGEMGFAKVPWDGTVLHLAALQGALVIYGDNGIAIGQYIDGSMVLTQILNTGIIGRGMVGASHNRHVFVAKDGNMYMLGGNPEAPFSPTLLGYQEYLTGGGGGVISFDQREEEFYVAKSSGTGYILSGSALTETNQVPNSVVRDGGTLLGTGVADPGTFSFTLSPLVLGTGSIKHAGSIEVIFRNLSSLTGEVYANYQYDGTFYSGGSSPVNDRGVVYTPASGVQLKAKVSGVTSGEGAISDLFLSWKAEDRSQRRGLRTGGGNAG